MSDSNERDKGNPPTDSARPDDEGKESIWRRWRREERARSAAGRAKAAAAASQADEEASRARGKRKDDNELDDDRDGLWDRLEGLVPDVLKRTIVGSFGSLVLSEDGLRQYLSELKLPKEVVGFILQHADNTKREFMRLLAREIREFLESTNFYDEIRRILTGLSFEIRTEIRLIPNEQQFVKPEVKNRVKLRRQHDGVVEESELYDSEKSSAQAQDPSKSEGTAKSSEAAGSTASKPPSHGSAARVAAAKSEAEIAAPRAAKTTPSASKTTPSAGKSAPSAGKSTPSAAAPTSSAAAPASSAATLSVPTPSESAAEERSGRTNRGGAAAAHAKTSSGSEPSSSNADEESTSEPSQSPSSE